MNYAKLMKDPYFVSLLSEIETIIHELDEDLLDEGISLNDTNVKSCLQKAMGHAKGKSPSFPDSNKNEQGMKRMSLALIELGEQLLAGNEDNEPVTKKDWVLCLKSVESSLKTRKEMHGHSRGYLDFLKRFIEEGEM